MNTQPSKELPFRSKIAMLKSIAQIIQYLHAGQRSLADPLIEDLKTRSVFLDEQIQQDVLAFAEQVQFQYDYDLNHLVTKDIQKAADKLIEDLGFSSPAP